MSDYCYNILQISGHPEDVHDVNLIFRQNLGFQSEEAYSNNAATRNHADWSLDRFFVMNAIYKSDGSSYKHISAASTESPIDNLPFSLTAHTHLENLKSSSFIEILSNRFPSISWTSLHLNENEGRATEIYQKKSNQDIFLMAKGVTDFHANPDNLEETDCISYLDVYEYPSGDIFKRIDSQDNFAIEKMDFLKVENPNIDELLIKVSSAMMSDDVSAMKLLGVPINQSVSHEWGLGHYAVFYKSKKILNYLLEEGLDLKFETSQGIRVMDILMDFVNEDGKANDLHERAEILKILLQQDLSLASDKLCSMTISPIDLCTRYGVKDLVDPLIEAGALCGREASVLSALSASCHTDIPGVLFDSIIRCSENPAEILVNMTGADGVINYRSDIQSCFYGAVNQLELTQLSDAMKQAKNMSNQCSINMNAILNSKEAHSAVLSIKDEINSLRCMN